MAKKKPTKKAPAAKTSKAPRRGGKKSLSGVPGRTPARMLGRVPDRQWAAWKIAAKRSGLNFSQWVRMILDTATKAKAA